MGTKLYLGVVEKDEGTAPSACGSRTCPAAFPPAMPLRTPAARGSPSAAPACRGAGKRGRPVPAPRSLAEVMAEPEVRAALAHGRDHPAGAAAGRWGTHGACQRHGRAGLLEQIDAAARNARPVAFRLSRPGGTGEDCRLRLSCEHPVHEPARVKCSENRPSRNTQKRRPDTSSSR